MTGIIDGAHQMDRHVRLVADNPAIVPGRNVEEVSGLQLIDGSIVHGGCRLPRYHHADVFHLAGPGANLPANVFRPAPSRIVSRAADGHAAYVDDFEFAP